MTCVTFQFHKGTIKTEYEDVFLLVDAEFQFHKGTIKTEYEDVFLLVDAEFQFHKGTIKTGLPPSIPQGCEISIP